ncbi:hypothetical protein BOTBODRAFT_36486 [Botryobasidium botryosum FD-172 SS1]|uniref:Uncharacterized protein n=1 Tax=Botryobasidium botryosum (strain FD-172 SS1) TaxID=930990 RepID=A0A067MF37_BOTB1|nr:hypothetical protein BOTBODRAFT_36486 [Botryobasidium botryosum FD-172 SS1]
MQDLQALAAALIVLIQVVSHGPVFVVAQTTSVVCSNTFAWMSNSRGQNPCLIAAYLLGQCNSGQWAVNPITDGSPYNSPNATTASSCQCSSVTYNLLSACEVCQIVQPVSWTDWNASCAAHPVPLKNWPLAIPAGTLIPAWAYLDPTTMSDDTFDPSVAIGSLSAPESGVLTSTIPSATISTTSTPLVVLPTASSHIGNDGVNNKVGSIVGGVVGGIAGLGLLSVTVVIMLYCHQTRNRQPSLETPPLETDKTVLNTPGTTVAQLSHTPAPSDAGASPTSLPLRFSRIDTQFSGVPDSLSPRGPTQQESDYDVPLNVVTPHTVLNHTQNQYNGVRDAGGRNTQNWGQPSQEPRLPPIGPMSAIPPLDLSDTHLPRQRAASSNVNSYPDTTRTTSPGPNVYNPDEDEDDEDDLPMVS